MLIAYVGARPVYVTLVSTGRRNDDEPDRNYETVQGAFRIQSKHVATTMDGNSAGDGPYSIEDVPWVMYFRQLVRAARSVLAQLVRVHALARLREHGAGGRALDLHVDRPATAGRMARRVLERRRIAARACTCTTTASDSANTAGRDVIPQH